MFNVPKRLTPNTKAAFEYEVSGFVREVMKKHEITGNLKVEALRGNRGVFAAVQVIDSPESSQKHYAFAQELKSVGIGGSMLFGWTENGNVVSPLFYPLTPNATH